MSILKTIAFVLLSAQACATNYYVANSGNDTNSGTSLSDPFETLQHASDQVTAGDTVFVSDGIYLGFDHRNTSGSINNPIVFKAAGNSALINQSGPIRSDGINIENADYIVIDGFIVNDMTGNGNGIRVVLSNNSIVRNNSCDNNAERGIFTAFTDDILIEYNVSTNAIDEHGIYVSNSSDRPIVRYNECYGNNSIGIHMNGDLSAGGDGIISDAMIYGNILYDNNQAAGINMDGVINAQVFNNLIYNNHNAQGIALFQQDGATCSYGAKIYNNTIIVPIDGRWGILVQDGCNVDTEIYNNIIINQHAWRGCIAAEDITGLTSDYNIVNDKMSDDGDGSTITLAEWQALGLDLNSQLANPLAEIFLDPTSSDYQLTTNSQAIDAATDLVSPLVFEDILGVVRPSGNAYDIGAYETVNSADLTIVSTMVPTNVTGITTVFFLFKIQELNNHPTEGTITFVLPKDERLSISFDPFGSSIGPFSNLDNANWTFDDSHPSFHFWSTDVILEANSSSTIGIEGSYDPQNSSGVVAKTISLIQGSGSEENLLNNIDVETLIYFSEN